MAILAVLVTSRISRYGRGRTCSSLPSTPDTRSSTAVQRTMTQPVAMRTAITRFTWWRDLSSEIRPRGPAATYKGEQCDEIHRVSGNVTGSWIEHGGFGGRDRGQSLGDEGKIGGVRGHDPGKDLPRAQRSSADRSEGAHVLAAHCRCPTGHDGGLPEQRQRGA